MTGPAIGGPATGAWGRARERGWTGLASGVGHVGDDLDFHKATIRVKTVDIDGCPGGERGLHITAIA